MLGSALDHERLIHVVAAKVGWVKIRKQFNLELRDLIAWQTGGGIDIDAYMYMLEWVIKNEPKLWESELKFIRKHSWKERWKQGLQDQWKDRVKKAGIKLLEDNVEFDYFSNPGDSSPEVGAG